jgi:uncharacterized protein YqgC (DUF456 family)
VTTTLFILAFLAILIASVLGVLLTFLTLPGTWLVLIVGVIIQYSLGKPHIFDDRTLLACLGIAIIGEIVEIVASAAGAKRAGGGRSASILSIIGAGVGAIAGGMIVPVIGAIPGGIAGAALGAIAGQRGIARSTWSHSLRVAKGAAIGRFVATIAKAGAAGLIGVILLIGVWNP